MNHETLAFLDLLLERSPEQEAEAYLTLTAIHPTEEKPRPSRHIRTNPLNHRKLIDDLEALDRANRSGWGSYFAVGLRNHDLGRWHRGGKEQLTALPAVFVDIDEPPDIALPRLERLPPASLVLSSGYGIHAYWLSEIHDLDAADNVIKAINQLVGGEKALNSASSMRLPGSTNNKPGRNTPCTILKRNDDLIYPLSSFPSLKIEPRQAPLLSSRTTRNHINPAVNQAVLDALYQRFQATPKSTGSRWHKALCPGGHRRDFCGSHFFYDSTAAAGNCFGRHGALPLKTLCDMLDIHANDLGGLYI